MSKIDKVYTTVEKLVDSTNVIVEPFVVTFNHKPIAPRNSIDIFSNQFTEMKAAGHSDSFIINPNEVIFTKHNINKVVMKMYQG